MQPEIVAPVDVTTQFHLQLAQRREPLPVDESRLQDLIGRLVHCVVVGVTLLGERAIYVVKTSSLCSVDGSEYSFGPKY